MGTKKNPAGEKTPRSEILKKYHEILVKFGKLADVNRKQYDEDGEYKSDDEDSMELSFTLDQIKAIIGESIEDVLNYGLLYRSHPASRLVKSQFSFRHKTLHEYFLAYFISNSDIESFKERFYKNQDLLKQELSLTRFIVHLYMSQEQALEFTTRTIGSKRDKNLCKGLLNLFKSTPTEAKPKPRKDLFIVLLKLYQGYQHDEYQTTLTFNTTEKSDNIFDNRKREYSYIYQYPCYVIRADRRHHDSLKSYNKDMIRRMSTDNKRKAVTVPLLQDASSQLITCDDSLFPFQCDFHIYCRPDYEVTVTGDGSKLKELYLRGIGKMGDINLHPVNGRLNVDIKETNLHGCVGLNKRWMALIQSLVMSLCNLEAGDISAIANSIQTCTSPTGGESASPCRLQELNLSSNSLTGAGSDIARIKTCIPLSTMINLCNCQLEAGDISVIADSMQACVSSTGAESASPFRLQKLDLSSNSLTGAGADIARIMSCIPLCTWINLYWCDLNDEDFIAIVNAIIQTNSDTSVHDHSTPDRRETSRIKPASPVPASHTDRIKPASPGPASHTDRRQTSRGKPACPDIQILDLNSNSFSDIETVRLLLDNLPPSLRQLDLSANQFIKDEVQEIRRTYKDKHPNLKLGITATVDT